MSAAQRVQPHLGQAPVQNLAFIHQVLDRAGDIFDRHLRVNPVLVEEIDAIGAQALEHALDGQLDRVAPPAIAIMRNMSRRDKFFFIVFLLFLLYGITSLMISITQMSVCL